MTGEMAIDSIHSETVCFAFTGRAVDGGTMDALAFSQSLEGLRNLILEANRVLNSDSLSVDVEISANFQHGSFEFIVKIKEKIVSKTADFFKDDNLQRLANICAILTFLGITPILGANLFSYLIDTKGEAIKEHNVVPDGNQIKIVCDGKEITIPIEVFKLQNDLPVRRNLEAFVKPLCTKDIDGLEVRKDKKVIQRIEKRDYFYLKTPDIKQEVDKHEEVSILTIVSPHMLHGDRWRFYDESIDRQFSAVMSDEKFIEDVFNKKYAFTSGDKIEALVRIVVIETKRGREERYEILKVYRHISDI